MGEGAERPGLLDNRRLTHPAGSVLSSVRSGDCSCALGLFAYQTFDAIDGKQARRTGTGSPLGELFDHG